MRKGSVNWFAVLLLVLGAGIAISASGCLGGDSEEEVSAATQAVLDNEDECLVSGVSWASPADQASPCAGPWSYQRFPTETNRHPLCGQSGECAQYASCPRMVPQPTLRPWEQFTLLHAGCGFVEGEGRVCRPDWNQAEARCAVFEANRVAEVEAPGDQVVTGHSRLVQLVTPSNATSHTFQCDVTINYDKVVNEPHPSCGCQLPVYNQCTHIVGATPNVRVVTAPGQTKAQVLAGHDDTAVGQVPDGSLNPICSTGEDVPSLVTKIDRLLQSLADATIAPPGGPVFAEIVKRAKLSYELLDNAQVTGAPHTAILNLYQQHPAIEPACGRHKPDTDDTCAGDWRLRLCTRLTSAHVKVGAGRGDLIRHLYAECIEQLRELGDSVEDEEAECTTNGDSVAASVDVHRRLHDKLLLRFGEALDPAPTADNVTRIADILHLIGGWYAQAARSVTEPYRMRAELDLAANKFWQVAYGYKRGTDETEWFADSAYGVLAETLDQAADLPPAAAQEMVEDALQETDTRGLKLDREVLTAAYGNVGSEPVLVGTPLLRFTGDALEALVDRLDALVQFHDVGCALANCVAFTTPTKLSRFWKVLAHLTAGPGASPNLEGVLAATSGTMLGWKAAFAAVEDAQQRLLDAIDAEAEAEIENPGLAQLGAVIDQARARTTAYETTGTFLPPVGNRLHTAVHVDERTRVKEHLERLNIRLAEKQADLESRLVQLVNGLVNVQEGETARAQLEAASDRLLTELDDLQQREKGYRALIARGNNESETSIFEELMKAWAAVQGSTDDEDYLRVGDSIDLFLSGQNANFDGWSGKTLADVGVQKIEVPAGRAISISTDGLWSPSCAIRAARVVDPNLVVPGGPRPITPPLSNTDLPTGPEGYSMSWTGSTFEAKEASRSDSYRLTIGAKLETCAKGDYLLGESSACVYVEGSASWERSKNWKGGTEGRTSTQFASGLFLPITPFEAAAGSLVVVEMPPGVTDPDQMRDVHLVRGPHTTLVIDEPADLWVAVNDTRCATRDTAHQLHVKIATFVSFGDAASALIKRMAHTISLVRDRLPALLERGEIMSSEATEIELEAKLGAIGEPGELQIAVDDYPAPMRDLFFKHLAREMTRLEASVRVRNIEREASIKESEYRAASLALRNGTLSGYLLSLVPKWTVRGLQFQELRRISSEYVRDIHDFVAPLLRVWHPEVLDDLDTLTPLQQLTNVDIDTPILVVTQRLTDMGAELAQRVEDAELPYPAPEETAPSFVALRFAAPTQFEAACQNTPSARCPARGQLGTFRWATTAQSRALWNALGQASDNQTMRRLVFEPSPDDLYQLLAGSAYLSCTKSLPVVRKVGLALTGQPSIPAEPRDLEGRLKVPALMSFTDATGTHQFELVNPIWFRLANVPLIYADSSYTAVRSSFEARAQDVRGVSPFTSFVFDIPETVVRDWNLRSSKSIDLIMELEAIRSSDVVATPECSTGP
jgi:hypothetical protein